MTSRWDQYNSWGLCLGTWPEGEISTTLENCVWGHDQQVRSVQLLGTVGTWPAGKIRMTLEDCVCGHDQQVRSVQLLWTVGTWPAGKINTTLEDCVWGHDQQVRSVWLLRTVFGDMTKGCLCASAVIISMLVLDTAGSVPIWNGRKPREPVQNQQTRKLINTSKMSHKHNSGGIYDMYLVFTCMPGESYCRWLGSLLCLCDSFEALINSPVCWFSFVLVWAPCPPPPPPHHHQKTNWMLRMCSVASLLAIDWLSSKAKWGPRVWHATKTVAGLNFLPSSVGEFL